MKTNIVINGKAQMTDAKFETAREALANIGKVANIAGKTVQDALQTLVKIGGYKGFADSLAKLPDSAKVEIFENDKPSSVYTAKKFAARILTAARADEWTGQIFTEKSGKKDDSDVEQSAPVLEL